jgi:isoleucyl-tRNA synthetase
MVTVSENPALQSSLTEFNAYICAEILADSLAFVPGLTDGIEIEVNDVSIKVHVTKKGV